LDTYVLVKCTHFIVWISDGHRGYSLRPISLCFALLCFAFTLRLRILNILHAPMQICKQKIPEVCRCLLISVILTILLLNTKRTLPVYSALLQKW